MGYRRGFKTEANSLAADIRRELGLRAYDRLVPLRLAKHLDIPVEPLSSFPECAPGTAYLLNAEPGAFSAVTVFLGTKRTIVHNDGHAPGRISSNLAHELAHGLLLHPPTPALDDRGNRLWDQDTEDEAEWLAGALLVTEDAALAIARGLWTVAEAAGRLGVSTQMINYRLNVTGARARVSRARQSVNRRWS